MPEPLVDDKSLTDYERDFSRDVEEPFTAEDKLALKQKVLSTLSEPVAMFTVGRVWSSVRGYCLFPVNHFTANSGPAVLLDPLVQSYPGYVITGAANFIVRNQGMGPHAFSLRVFLAALVGMCLCLNYMTVVRITTQNFVTPYDKGDRYDTAFDDQAAILFIPGMIWCGCLVFAPYEYHDFSSWGVYCCTRSQQIRAIRCFVLDCAFMGWLNQFVSRTVFYLQSDPQIATQVAVFVFAWKRLLFCIMISINYHDTPWKGYCLMNCWDSLMANNILLVMSQTGVGSWWDALIYMAAEWAIFLLRIQIVGRLGAKTCPRLVRYLNSKHLENMPAPYPNYVKACGAKLAMRASQGFLCYLEGSTMTTLWSVQWIHGVWLLALPHTIGREFFLVMQPMGSLLVFLLFLASSVVQDSIASYISGKLSNYSYLQSSKGWLARKLFLVRYFKYCAAGGQFVLYATINQAVKLTEASRLPLADEWHASMHHHTHY